MRHHTITYVKTSCPQIWAIVNSELAKLVETARRADVASMRMEYLQEQVATLKTHLYDLLQSVSTANSPPPAEQQEEGAHLSGSGALLLEGPTPSPQVGAIGNKSHDR